MQILCESRAKNRKAELELVDLHQKLSEAEGDIKVTSYIKLTLCDNSCANLFTNLLHVELNRVLLSRREYKNCIPVPKNVFQNLKHFL